MDSERLDIGVSHGNNQPSREDSEGSKHCVIAKTRRLILREFKADDLDEIYSVCDSWGEVPGLLPLSDDRDEEREKLESYIHFMYGFYGMGLWAICLAADGRMIGFGGPWPSQIGEDWLLELGYVIHKDYSRKGYGYEAMSAVVDYIRSETDFEKAAARIPKEHKGSRGLARKLGMHLDTQYFDEDAGMCLNRLDIS